MKTVKMVTVLVVLLLGTVVAQQNDSTNSGTLTWTAPGDDTTWGTASFYDIRCSRTSITDGNWINATQLQNEPAPLLAGTIQSYLVTGLLPGTEYHFKIRAFDEVMNGSDLSNEAVITTAEKFLYGQDIVIFKGYFNADVYQDIGFWDKSSKMVFVALRDPLNNCYMWNNTPWLILPSNDYVLLTGKLNTDGLTDLCFFKYLSGDWYPAICQDTMPCFILSTVPWITGWGNGPLGTCQPSLNRLNNDSLDDGLLFFYSTGNIYVAYNMGGSFQRAGSGPWITGWGNGPSNTCKFLSTKLNGDSLDDGLLFFYSTGNIYVAYNMGGSFQRAGSGPWITGWGNGPYGSYDILAGNLNNDELKDLYLFNYSAGNMYGAYNMGGSFQRAGSVLITGWGNGPYGTSQPLLIDINNNSNSDALIYQGGHGCWFGAQDSSGLLVRCSGPYIYSAMIKNWGIQRISSGRVISEFASLDLPDGFNLNQNYPNPFNPTTTIAYSLPEPGHVTLKIYNIMGQQVDIVVDEYKEPGEYQITWNASDRASGMYIARISTEAYSKSIKMTLLK